MAKFYTTFHYPTVVPWTGVDGEASASPGTGLAYVHPSLLRMRDTAIETENDIEDYPTDPHESGDEQGTPYRFTTSEEAHHERAWNTVGWQDVTVRGEVRFPTITNLRDGNGAPHTPWYEFEVILNDVTIDDKDMVNSCVLTGGTVTGHPGLPSGELVTNCGMTGDLLGTWQFPEPVNDYPSTPIFDEIVDTINVYDIDATGGDGLMGQNNIRLRIWIFASGNSGLLYYVRDGTKYYVSICEVTLYAELYDEGPYASGGDVSAIYEMADGTSDPDESMAVTIGGSLGASRGEMFTNLIPTSLVKGTDAEEGEVSIEDMTPDMVLYRRLPHAGSTLYDVPWTYDGSGSPVPTAAEAEFQDVEIIYGNPKYSIKPTA